MTCRFPQHTALLRMRGRCKQMPNVIPPVNFPKRLLMGPGPCEVDPRVYRAMIQPVVGHMDPFFLEVLDQLQELLRRTFRTGNAITLPITGTGSAGME